MSFIMEKYDQPTNQYNNFDKRKKFYFKCVDKLIKDKSASILICGGGTTDKVIFQLLGFTNVTISNFDTRIKGDEYFPYNWKFENAESLSFDNETFDFVIMNAAIHHCPRPHKALTEMYRVAKIGILALEGRDSFTSRFLTKMQVSETYECIAVFRNDCKYGGLNNTDIPNYVYRWTEREVEKTIQSFAPYFNHKYIYNYDFEFPHIFNKLRKVSLKYIFARIIEPFFYLFIKLFPKQQNLFSFYIEKPNIKRDLFPWLCLDENEKIIFNRKWGEEKFKNKENNS